MLPPVGCSKPAIMRSVVVLPQPDGPSIVKNSPSAIGNDASRTASTVPKLFETPSSEMAALSALTWWSSLRTSCPCHNDGA